jgi:hypothetical protein
MTDSSKVAVVVTLCIGLIACNNKPATPPAEQCLASFRNSLKDPESGRVVSFSEGQLVYTATNSYGARIQGRALCQKIGEVWSRDTSAELLAVLRLTAETLETYNVCRKKQQDTEQCAGGSLALKAAARSRLDTEALQRESAEKLGFR